MKVVFIFAHPDDETFSSAGTIAKLTQNGRAVVLITATRGEAGQTGNPPITTKENLGAVREQELLNAAHILGIINVHFLDYQDGTLSKVPIGELKDKILPLLQQEKPDVVVTFNKEGGSRHPDHIHINKCATKAFNEYVKSVTKPLRLYYTVIPPSLLQKLARRGFSYTAFGTILGTPFSEITTVIDISETLPLKILAFKQHKTQHQDWERYLRRSDMPEFSLEFFKLIQEHGFFGV